MTRSKTTLIVLCGLSAIVVTSSLLLASVRVGNVRWETLGGAGIPDDEAIQGNWYQAVTKGGRVKYRGDHTNALRFTYPVSSVNSAPTRDTMALTIYYQDPDGSGENFKVAGRLMSFAKSNGSLSEVCSVESDKSGQWNSSTTRGCGSLDLTKNLYWLEVTITRKQASPLTVEFNGAQLEEAVD